MTGTARSTTGPHVFVAPVGDGDDASITDAVAHHLISVLRIREGDPVSLADDTGQICQATVTRRHAERVDMRIDQRWVVPRPAVAITLVQALPKGRKMEEVVQHATEVGVDRIVPVVTARCVKQPAGKDAKLLARWRAVAHAAARQSRRARLPQVSPIQRWPVTDLVGVLAWEDASTPLARALPPMLQEPPDEIAIAIGPEGGFDVREVEATPGLVPVSLGPTILRTETAGVVGPALLVEHLRIAGYA